MQPVSHSVRYRVAAPRFRFRDRYIIVYVCECVCVCREREREREGCVSVCMMHFKYVWWALVYGGRVCC